MSNTISYLKRYIQILQHSAVLTYFCRLRSFGLKFVGIVTCPRILFLFLLLFLLPITSFADISRDTLPIPRFVTIKFDEVNARTGPAVDCPIEWVFIRKGEPVEIVAQYEQWRKIRDINEEGGWIHSSALSGKRSVILVAKNIMPLIAAPGKYDDIVVKLKPQIRCSLVKCKNEWCQITCQSYKGWIARKYLWGVYPDE
jgi:SH3-like domain-containing protein